MTHVRTSYPLTPYNGKQVPEQPGDRLVVLTWKSSEKTGKIAWPSVCFSVPSWVPELIGADCEYLPMLIASFEARQKSIAFQYATEMLGKDGRCMDIPADTVSNDVVLLDFIEEQEKDEHRGKLSEEQIKTWFAQTMEPMLIIKLAEAKNWIADGYEMSEQEHKKLKQSAANYRALLQKLAAPTPDVTTDTAKQLKHALNSCGVVDGQLDQIANKLNKKLDKIINPMRQAPAIALDAIG
jgi:hypothetical protein